MRVFMRACVCVWVCVASTFTKLAHANVYEACKLAEGTAIKGSPVFGSSHKDAVRQIESVHELSYVKSDELGLVYVKPFSQIRLSYMNEKLHAYTWVYSEEFMEDFSGNLDLIYEEALKKAIKSFGEPSEKKDLTAIWKSGSLKMVLHLDKCKGELVFKFECSTGL
jgi:hypothetical protein